jgi:hypothetical protein
MLARVVSSWLDEAQRGHGSEELRVPRRASSGSSGASCARSTPPLVLHGAPEVKQDAWDTAANTHLLNYITSGLVQRRFTARSPRESNRYAPDPLRFGEPRVIPGDHRQDAVLVKWKNAWARDMREDRELYDGKLEGKAFWQQCMASAEGEIDQLLRAIAA